MSDKNDSMIEQVRAEAIAVAVGCLDYRGGYDGPEYEAFQAGVATVANALRAWAERGTADTQVRALVRIGMETCE